MELWTFSIFVEVMNGTQSITIRKNINNPVKFIAERRWNRHVKNRIQERINQGQTTILILYEAVRARPEEVVVAAASQSQR